MLWGIQQEEQVGTEENGLSYADVRPGVPVGSGARGCLASNWNLGDKLIEVSAK